MFRLPGEQKGGDNLAGGRRTIDSFSPVSTGIAKQDGLWRFGVHATFSQYIVSVAPFLTSNPSHELQDPHFNQALLTSARVSVFIPTQCSFRLRQACIVFPSPLFLLRALKHPYLHAQGSPQLIGPLKKSVQGAAVVSCSVGHSEDQANVDPRGRKLPRQRKKQRCSQAKEARARRVGVRGARTAAAAPPPEINRGKPAHGARGSTPRHIGGMRFVLASRALRREESQDGPVGYNGGG